MLPTMKIGNLEVTRLIVGSNPFTGKSHLDQTVDADMKDYFSEKYNADSDKLYIPNTERSTLTYIAMKNHCDRRGISVFNATRGGKLEVFPRADFDSLFI